MKYRINVTLALALALSFALGGCAAVSGDEAPIGQDVEESTSVVATPASAEIGGEGEAVVTTGRVLSSEARSGQERFGGGHPDPWSPPPGQGPKPEK